MIVQKQITTTQPIDITITGITLLSIEEYEACRDVIPKINDWWWLRSPGGNQDLAAYVRDDGSIIDSGINVSFDKSVVRPVVVVRLSESEIDNLQIGTKFVLAGYTWTMIAPTMAICDTGVGRTAFRRDWQAPDANDYEKSDIKAWLEKWAREKGIIECLK